MARIQATAQSFDPRGTLEELRGAGVQLAYWTTDPDGDRAQKIAEEHGGFLADRRVTYRCEQLLTAEDPQTVRRYGDQHPSPALTALAIESGRYSRFSRDPKIPRSVFIKLYETWIAKSTNAELADRVFVSQSDDDNIDGMVTVVAANKVGRIGLIAVHSAARGRGRGKSLISAAHRYYGSVGASAAEVVTQQENLAACRLYESCGYKLAKSELVYHFWL